jgi:excisionase family DNA binding protein
VARRLGVEPVTIYRWCRQGRLTCLKPGKEWRIRRSALEAFLRRAETPRTLAAHLGAFLTQPDQVLAVAETPTLLTRLDAAFFHVAEATDGLLIKIYDPHADSHRTLRQQLQRQGLDAEGLEATGRLRWCPVAEPAAGVAALRQCLEAAADGERTVWATIDWGEDTDLDAALEQQAALAGLVATHPLVVLTGVAEPAVDTWPTAADQWRLLGSLRGVVRLGRVGLVLSRVLPPPAA